MSLNTLIRIIGLFVLAHWIQVTNLTNAQPPSPISPNAPIEVWEALLEPTEGCPLPCLWGIVPGQTSFENVQPSIQSRFPYVEIFGGVAEYPPYQGMVFENFTYQSTNLPMSELSDIGLLDIYATNGVVDLITLISSDNSEPNFPEPLQAWDYFLPVNMITLYGPPDVIYLYAEQKETLISTHLSFYWDQGIEVSYIKFGLETIPCYGAGQILGYVVRLTNPGNLERIFLQNDPASYGLRRLDEISNYTNAEFAQLLVDNQGCLPSDLAVNWQDVPWLALPTEGPTATLYLSPIPSLTPSPTVTPSPTPIPCPSNSACFTVGNFRAVQYTGDPRVYIERSMAAGIDPFDSPPTDGWTMIGRTNGAGDNGVLRAFTVLNNVPYAALQHPSKGCIVVTPKSLGPRTQGQTRLVNIIEQGNSARCNGDWSGLGVSQFPLAQPT
jgi:hypothetical protein